MKKRTATFVGFAMIVGALFSIFGVWGVFGDIGGYSVACSNDVSPSLNYQADNIFSSTTHANAGTTYIWSDGQRISDVTTPSSFGAGDEITIAMTGNASIYGSVDNYRIKCQNTDYLNLDVADCSTAPTASWKDTVGTAATALVLGAADNKVFTLTLLAAEDQCFGNPDEDNTQGLLTCFTGDSGYYSSWEANGGGTTVGVPYLQAGNTSCIEWDRKSVCDGSTFSPEVRVKTVGDVNATFPTYVVWVDSSLYLTQEGGIAFGTESDASTPVDTGRIDVPLTVTIAT